MEEIDQILDSLPRDEEARRRVREWVEQTTDPEQIGNQGGTPSQSEAASSEDDADTASPNRRLLVIRGRVETGTPSSSASARGTRRVVAALGRPHSGNHIPQGSTAALGGPSRLRAALSVPEGARSALGRPLSRESTEESTAQKGPRGKWPLGRPRHAKGKLLGESFSEEEAESTPRHPPEQARTNSLTEGSGSSVTPGGGAKRPLEEALLPQQKRQRLSASASQEDSDTESEDLINFDPTELVKNREGTFVTPKSVSTYLSKHLRRCLTKEEREALFKEHPRPDAEVCTVPKVDKYMTEFLGKQLPKDNEAQLTKIQAAILAVVRPLTAAWRDLLEAGLKENPEIAVPATDVLGLIQRTICLVGNASELTSQIRREKILTAIDPSWSKFSSEEFPMSSKNTLFGEEFQSKLTSMVEKDTALAKAVSITKRHKKDKNPPPTKKAGLQTVCFFFEKAPLAGTGTGGARIFNRTHNMRANTGIQSEDPTRSTAKPTTNNTIDQGRNHYSTNHASRHHRHSQNPNRRSTRGTSLSSSDPASGFGDIPGHEYRNTGGPPSGGGQTTALSTELASYNGRPLDLEYGEGIQFGTNISTKPAPPTYTHNFQPGESSSTHVRNTKAVAETSNQSGRKFTGRVSEPGLLGPQGRRGVAPSDQSSRSQLTHRPPPFQNGGNQDSEGAHEERGLARKAGSEGCVSLSANESGTHTPLEIPMAESNVSIQHTSLWTLQCPLRVYEAPQASSGNPQKAGNQSGPLLRRHAHHGRLQGGSPTPSSNSNASPDSSGVYTQPRQERFDALSKGRFLGILLGLSYLANLITNLQDPVHTAVDQRVSSSETDNNLRAITAAGINDIHSPSSSTCSIVLPPFRESQDNSSEAQPELQHGSNNIGRDEERSNLVASTITQTQWQVNANNTMGHGDGVRCINTGLGSKPQRYQHRRIVDTGRESLPHQLPRVAGSISSPEDLCYQLTSQNNPTEARQRDGNCLPQQDGGDSFSPTVQFGNTNLEVVLGEEYIHPRRTPPRETQCESRLALSACTGLQRLADASGNLPPTSGQAGTLLNRSVCVPHECPASDLLQLEAGPIGSSNRCSINLMEGSSPLPVPTILTPHPLPGEDQQGEGGGSSNSSSVVQPGMVPITAPESTGCTNLAPQHDGHHTESSGRATPTGSEGTPPASRLACVRQSYGSKGLSDRVVAIMQKSWRKSTESAYSSVWRRWSSWCDQQQADPVSAPLNMVLDYLTELYEEGKQYRTINTARSAISMTHDPVDGWKVGQHPLTIRFLKGIFNSRPPAPRYTNTWDVDKVLVCIHNLPDNGELSLTILTHKLAMLMALTNADRCSELASLDLQYRSYLKHGVKFVIPGLTKTRRSGPPKEVFYPSYPEDVKLCPVRTLESYELRTKPLRLLSKADSNSLFLSVRKPHAPVKAATIGHWLQKLMAQAGIDVSIFSAHSTRGAATSKAKNVGVSTADILKTADWSSVSTFRRFYQRPIKGNEFGRRVLKCSQT